jgi:hypothetical protein
MLAGSAVESEHRMPDYSADIAALKTAIASGATEVRYTDYSVRFDSLEKMLARLRWLENQQSPASAGAIASVVGFSRGDR